MLLDLYDRVRTYHLRKIFAYEAIYAVLNHFEFETVLDIGSGSGTHKRIFQEHNKKVTSVDFGTSTYFGESQEQEDTIIANYLETNLNKQFDLVWASHVLEHQLDAHQFLSKLHKDLKEGGVLAITVPPMSSNLAGGHLSAWNAGLLIYNLILAGFNCKNAAIKRYRYNISVIVRKETIRPSGLSYDTGDISLLNDFFPDCFNEGCNGDIRRFNWNF